jgi:FAD/FMN-containing dehydrogenase
MITDNHIKAFQAFLDAKAVSTDAQELAPHLVEWRDKFKGASNLLLKPSTTDEVAKIITYCNEHRLAIIPQGGNTGLVGGGIPGLDESRPEILLSMKRMRRNIQVSKSDYSITADAGLTVSELEAAAIEHDRHFPLSLASEGSCTLGGIISTNAGGVHVVRYGTTRALVLGIEAVLPNGEIFSDLSTLRKDNTGYDLKQLLIGAEGTLGIITKASMQLVPIEHNRLTAWLAIKTPSDALILLSKIKEQFSDMLSAFELMPDIGLDMVLKHITGTRAPISTKAPWYVLMELGTNNQRIPLQSLMEAWLGNTMETGILEDAAIASSLQDRDDFWRLRETMSEAQKHEGGSIKHDISVPVDKVPEFLTVANKAIADNFAGARPTPFGHLGDGNLHYNIMQPTGADKDAFLSNWQSMNEMVHDIVVSYGGSISAEHGIGTMKKDELKRVKPKAEIATMKAIKQAFDPNNIMNPGALFSDN